MTGNDAHLIGQDHQLALDGVDEFGGIATRQIGTAHASGKEGVASNEQLDGIEVEANRAFAVPRRVQNLRRKCWNSNDLPIHKGSIGVGDLGSFHGQPAGLRGHHLEQRDVVFVHEHGGTREPAQFGDGKHVVDVSVREQNLPDVQLAFGNALKDPLGIATRIDHDTFAAQFITNDGAVALQGGYGEALDDHGDYSSASLSRDCGFRATPCPAFCPPVEARAAHSPFSRLDLKHAPQRASFFERNALPMLVLNRREWLKGAAATAALAQMGAGSLLAHAEALPSARPKAADRRFKSAAVEDLLPRIAARIADPNLATIFTNCYPNTLDTTVHFGSFESKPDTYVVTGDIDAMWLRDSSAQLWPYLPLAKEDDRLRQMLEGAIRRQARCILIDPYANAFMHDAEAKPLEWSTTDLTDHIPGVGERKWEIDSLCYPIRLAHGYWKTTGDTHPFDNTWKEAAWTVVRTFRTQQRKNGPGPYHFQRAVEKPTDTLALGGYGYPARPVGLIFSGFRPSDDACLYPLFIPANHFAVITLQRIAEMAHTILHDEALASEATALADEVSAALAKYGKTYHAKHGEIWAYEVDGFGNSLMMDDANASGLLSMAYLGLAKANDPLYQRTRGFALSPENPYFFKGRAAEGIGGPHVALDMIWPMAILYRGFTATEEGEIRSCLQTLCATTAGTGFMHESFHKDDPSKFTRAWFAWANTLFGELVVKLATERPALLATRL